MRDRSPWLGALAALASTGANAAPASICQKPLIGEFRTVDDITPAEDVVATTDQLEERELHATAVFSAHAVTYDGNTCLVRKTIRTMTKKQTLRLYPNPVVAKYPMVISFKCKTEEGVNSFYIGQSCDEIVTNWEGSYFLLKRIAADGGGH